jgi:hypothetical protein
MSNIHERYCTTHFNGAGVGSRCRRGVRNKGVARAGTDGSNLDCVGGWEDVSKFGHDMESIVSHRGLRSTPPGNSSIGRSCEREPIFRVNLESVKKYC